MEAQYKIIRHVDRTDYLEHAILKGSERKNHKYLAREWLGNKWKYFYTQAELNARKGVNKILRRQDSKEDQKRYKDLEKRSVQYKKNSEKAGKEIRSNLSKAVANGKKQISSAMKKIGSWTTKQVKEAKQTVDKGRKAVSNMMNGHLEIVTTSVDKFYPSWNAMAKATVSAAGKQLKKGNIPAAVGMLDTAATLNSYKDENTGAGYLSDVNTRLNKDMYRMSLALNGVTGVKKYDKPKKKLKWVSNK